MGFLAAKDTISGQEGRAYATIDGRVEEMFYIKTIQGKVEKKKTEVKTIGRRGNQNKAIGWSGSGSMTIYYITSLFREIMIKYIKEGVDTYFDITVVNEDPNSSVGKQTVVLKGVNLNDLPMTMLDVSKEVLEEEINFTFEDVDILDSFGKPII